MKKVIILMMGLAVLSTADTTYKDGGECDCDSIHKAFYEMGALMWETPYVNGKKQGVEKDYYESGALRREIPYVNGKEHGVEKYYYESGDLMRELPYVNGKRHGVSKKYYSFSGGLMMEAPYVNGELHGVMKWYNGRENGSDKLWITTEYKNDMIVRQQTMYRYP